MGTAAAGDVGEVKAIQQLLADAGRAPNRPQVGMGVANAKLPQHSEPRQHLIRRDADLDITIVALAPRHDAFQAIQTPANFRLR